jgi:hypothetical protein
VICSGPLKGVAEVETDDELELTPRTFESVGCVLLPMPSAFELSATGPLKIGATDADGFCKVTVGL